MKKQQVKAYDVRMDPWKLFGVIIMIPVVLWIFYIAVQMSVTSQSTPSILHRIVCNWPSIGGIIPLTDDPNPTPSQVICFTNFAVRSKNTKFCDLISDDPINENNEKYRTYCYGAVKKKLIEP